MALDPGDAEDVELVRAALQAKADLRSVDRGRGHAIALLLISLFLFWTMQQSIAGQTGAWIAALVIVLAVHEGGHWLAMRAFGYTDLRVFFIPFLGAAASGTKQDASATQRAIVSLAGPVPGIVFALVATWFIPIESELLANVVVLALYLNAFNLLPFVPLDGGRYLDTSLFARWPAMRQIVGHLSGLALAGIGWMLEAWILLGFGVFTFLFAGTSRITGQGAAELRKLLEPGEGPPGAFPDRLIPAGIELANALIFSKSSVSAAPDRYANALTNFWAKVGDEPPSGAMTVVLLAAYLGAIGLVVAALARLGVI